MSFRYGATALTTTTRRVAVAVGEPLRVDQIWVANTSAASVNLRIYHLAPGESASTSNALVYDLVIRTGTLYQLLGVNQPLDLGIKDELHARASASGLTLTMYRA